MRKLGSTAVALLAIISLGGAGVARARVADALGRTLVVGDDNHGDRQTVP